MKSIAQVALLVALSALLLSQLIFGWMYWIQSTPPDETPKLPAAPTRPVVPDLPAAKSDDTKERRDEVALQRLQLLTQFAQDYEAFKLENDLYTKHLASYDKSLTIRKNASSKDAFTLIVKDTFLPLITQLAAAFAAYALVSGAAYSVYNGVANKSAGGVAPEKPKLLGF